MESQPEASKTTWERHVNTVLSGVAVVLLVWNWQTTQQLEVNVAVQSQQIATLTEAVKATSQDRYTVDEARRDFSERDRVMGKYEAELQDIKKELEKIREKVYRNGN